MSAPSKKPLYKIYTASQLDRTSLLNWKISSDNSNFQITIVYEGENKKEAERAREVLLNQGYKIEKVGHWTLWKERGDPRMSYFFTKGPVLRYDKNHIETNNKINDINEALTQVFPNDKIVISGDNVEIPGTNWGPPLPFNVELWVFH